MVSSLREFALCAGVMALCSLASPVGPLARSTSGASAWNQLSPQIVMEDVHATYVKNTLATLSAHEGCTAESIAVRKEWSSLSEDERLDYISAVKCLASLPARTSPALAPGAKSRWDDFVVAHMINTKTVHFSGFLLPWHRQMIWNLEQALRNECNYTGYQPYVDWSQWAYLNTSANPLYDGSATSLSGNGAYVQHNATTITLPGGNPPQNVTFPPGTGGGCVYEGPLVDWKVNLGPVQVIDSIAGKANPQADGLGYNPRCLQRDFNSQWLQQWASWTVVANGTVNSTDIHMFHPWLESTIHGSGHIFIGGENDDLFISPTDPLFFFHHAWIDRAWAMWQSLDFANRTHALDGTHTFMNYPESPDVTLNDTIYFSPAFANLTVDKVMSPTKEAYCYYYS